MEDIDEILNHCGIGETLVISALHLKKAYEKMCAGVVGDLPLTQNEVDIMLFLTHNKQIDTAAEIARCRAISKSQICKSVDDLTGQGYLLVRQDQKDRRYQHLYLSERGIQFMEKMEEVRRDFLDNLRQNITEEEMEVFCNVLCKIRDNVRRT